MTPEDAHLIRVAYAAFIEPGDFYRLFGNCCDAQCLGVCEAKTDNLRGTPTLGGQAIDDFISHHTQADPEAMLHLQKHLAANRLKDSEL